MKLRDFMRTKKLNEELRNQEKVEMRYIQDILQIKEKSSSLRVLFFIYSAAVVFTSKSIAPYYVLLGSLMYVFQCTVEARFIWPQRMNINAAFTDWERARCYYLNFLLIQC